MVYCEVTDEVGGEYWGGHCEAVVMDEVAAAYTLLLLSLAVTTLGLTDVTACDIVQ